METLNGLDAGMLAGETPEWHMHGGALILLEPLPGHAPDVARELGTMLEARRAHLTPLRRRLREAPLGLGRPVWLDDGGADLAAHVHRVDLGPSAGVHDVAAFAGEVFSHPLDRRHRLWEFWVLEGLEHGRSALLVKVHHALMDGVRGEHLYEVLFDLEPDAPLHRPDGDTVLTDPEPSTPRMLAASAAFLAATPVRLAGFGAEAAAALTRLARVLASPARHDAAVPLAAPRTSMNRPLTARRAFAFSSVPLRDMRAVKQAFGVTMNDVALELCADVLRRYLVARDELPERSLVAQIPVGVHRDGGNTAGNFVAATGALFHTEIADPVARLQAIHTSMQAAKAIQAALGDDIVVDTLGVVPPALISGGMRVYRGLGLGRVHPPIFNAIVSNVAGPPVPLYTCGCRIVATHVLGPLLVGCGLNITLMSVENEMHFGVAVCPDVIDAPWEIADAIPDALATLVKAVDE